MTPSERVDKLTAIIEAAMNRAYKPAEIETMLPVLNGHIQGLYAGIDELEKKVAELAKKVVVGKPKRTTKRVAK